MADKAGLLVKTRIHTTGRNGKHYLFRTKDRYQTGTDLVLDGSPRKGIDLRANGGYVIWWPLCGYNVTGDEIADLPAGLIDERRFRPERDMAPLPSSAPAAWSLEAPKVSAALKYLAPEGYDRWIKVGMAIHDASGGSDEGFALWHEWSATGDSYDGIEDCRYHWASFGRYEGRKIGLGSLFSAAMEAGYLPASGEAATAPAVAGEEHPLTLRPLFEIVAEQREPEWLLEDILEANVLAVLAGPRGTFKSFIGLDWGMRVAATGQPVVILSGEGAGLDRRADAWVRTHGGGRTVDEFPVFALERAINLNADQDIINLRSAIERLERPPALIEIDTFSKFSAGLDENDNGEVSTYLSRLTRFLREQYRATVLLVAHSGHGDQARPRGASALMANPDAEYIVSRPSPTDMNVSVSRERFKDCPSLPALGYEAQVIDLGRLDRRGKPVTSLALMPGVPMPLQVKSGGKNVERALVALREYHRVNPESRFLTSDDLKGMFAAQGLDRKRRPEVINWLVTTGILTTSVGGHAFDPTNL
jgi:hypothetical protein